MAGSDAHAAPVQLVIHNGLAPPDPANVIDADYDPFLFDVFVRNVGCGNEFPFDGPCPAPGAPTAVALVEGGVVENRLEVYDTSALDVSGGSALLLRARGHSTLSMRGGTITNTLEVAESAFASITGGSVEQFVQLFDAATVELRGGRVARVLPAGASRFVLARGAVEDHVAASGAGRIVVSSGTIGTFLAGFDAASVRLRGGAVGGPLSANGALVAAIWSGGTVGGDVLADGGSTLLVQGSGFAVDGTPVPDGPLPSQSGLVCGTQVLTGTIVVPEPGRAIAGLAVLAALSAVERRRSRARPRAGRDRLRAGRRAPGQAEQSGRAESRLGSEPRPEPAARRALRRTRHTAPSAAPTSAPATRGLGSGTG